MNNMENVNTEIVQATYEHPETVAIIYPSDLEKESIFINNRKCLLDKFYRWLQTGQQLEYEEKVLSALKFDIQINKQISTINDLRERLSKTENSMNENMSPYRWRILKDISGYLGDSYVEANFVLVLYREGDYEHQN